MTEPDRGVGWEPVLAGFHPDPSMCCVDGVYYLLTSSFGYHPGLPVHRSTDLVTWELIGHVLVGESWLDLRGLGASWGVWAPTIRHHAGTFFVVVTVAGPTSVAGNYLTTASDPAGPWSPPRRLAAEGIDPDLFVDRDGRAWVCGARDAAEPDRPGLGPGEIWLRELDLDTLELVGPTHVLWHGAMTSTWVEGPHLYERDGRYLLVGAEGGTERNHAVTCAVADAVTGPFRTDPRSPLLTHRHLGESHPVQNVGHADLVTTPDGGLVAVVLGVRPIAGHHVLGRETFLVPGEWSERGLVLAPGVGAVPPRAPSPTRPALDWISLRGPVSCEVAGTADALATNADALAGAAGAAGATVRLAPTPVPLDAVDGVPGLVGVRQDAHRFRFAATLALDARDALDALDRAGDGDVRLGLAVVQDERHHLTVHVVPGSGAPGRSAGEDAAPHVRVALREAGEEAVLAVVPLGAVVPRAVTLEVASDGLTYEVALRSDEGGAPNAPAAALRRVLARVPHRALSGETAQSFAGAVLALVAEGPAKGPAVTFRGVRYER